MCDKCQKNSKHWVHLADNWTEDERIQMFDYLLQNYKITTSKLSQV